LTFKKVLNKEHWNPEAGAAFEKCAGSDCKDFGAPFVDVFSIRDLKWDETRGKRSVNQHKSRKFGFNKVRILVGTAVEPESISRNFSNSLTSSRSRSLTDIKLVVLIVT